MRWRVTPLEWGDGGEPCARIHGVAAPVSTKHARVPDLDVRLLGGVDVLFGEHRVAIGGAKPRALLALLALQPNVPVSVDRLVDDVWGEHAPPTVRGSVQVHVSNLRRALAGAGVDSLVETRGSGYVFAADPSVVDVHRFGDEARRARDSFSAGDLSTARMSAQHARALWRGVPLAGIGDAPFVQGRVASLESEFLALVDLYADIDIALGRSADVLGELEWVVAEHPYREPTWARLALALYRAGRQVDALARLRTARRLLADDLGLEPSEELVALEVAILNQDPALRGIPAHQSSAEWSPSDGDDLVSGSQLPSGRRLVGRDDLVRAIVEELADTRLLTVVGPGGVGKTSSAVAAASVVTDSSARFVDLAAIADSDGLVPTLLTAVGARADDLDEGIGAVAATLNSYHQPLLVLDNCEHLLPSVAGVAVELLGSCPSLRLLATSREPLDVPGESVIGCPPLSLESAIDLWTVRAQSAHRDYVVDEPERAAVAALVQRLDGLPLAIELFAARVRSLTAAEMLARFDDAEMLGTSWRSAPAERQRSLRSVVSWSYALLRDDERRCLRRMSVFGGGVGIDGIDAVCQPEHRHTLDQLVRSSLVVAERSVLGVRYRLLATVRAFAAGELEATDDAELTRRRLLHWVGEWANGLAVAFAGPDPVNAIDELAAGAANVRVAYDLVAAQPREVARLLARFGPWGLSFTLALPEAVTWATLALGSDDLDETDRMILLILAAHLSNVGTDDRRARLREAMSIAERVGDDAALAFAGADLALASIDNTSESLAVAERAMEVAARANQPVALSWALNVAATTLVRSHRFDDAAELLDRHCVLGTRRFGVLEGHVLFQRGRLVMLQGDLEGAARHFAAAEQAATRTGSLPGRSTAWFGMAEVDRLSGRIEAAYDGYRRCLPVDLIVEPGETGLVRMMIVWTACLLGEIAVAEHHAAVLADEYALESAITEGTTMLAAVAVGAEGLLALAKGMDAAATETLRRAIALWADSDCWDVVADLLDRLPEVAQYRADGARLHALAAEVRRGTVSMHVAVASI